MRLQYKIVIIITALSAIFTKAQVGIAINPSETFKPHSSSILHLDVSNLPVNNKKGFLLPRVNLTDVNDGTTIPNPMNGLWVYNLASTSGVNGVAANNIYKWNGTRWNRYYSRQEIINFLEPNNYYLSSTGSQILSTSQLSTLNSGSPIIVNWNNTDVVITNDQYVSISGTTEFLVNESGVYTLAGFFNYHPEIASSATTTATDIRFVLQVYRNSSWQNLTATSKAIESLSGSNYQSVAFPSNVVSLIKDEKLRFVFLKTGSNHGTNAGIKSSTGIGTKSLRISYLSEL